MEPLRLFHPACVDHWHWRIHNQSRKQVRIKGGLFVPSPQTQGKAKGGTSIAVPPKDQGKNISPFNPFNRYYSLPNQKVTVSVRATQKSPKCYLTTRIYAMLDSIISPHLSLLRVFLRSNRKDKCLYSSPQDPQEGLRQESVDPGHVCGPPSVITFLPVRQAPGGPQETRRLLSMKIMFWRHSLEPYG